MTYKSRLMIVSLLIGLIRNLYYKLRSYFDEPVSTHEVFTHAYIDCTTHSWKFCYSCKLYMVHTLVDIIWVEILPHYKIEFARI